MTDAPVCELTSPASPRTADEPMAFTQGELWRGGLYTWLFFLAALCVWVIVPVVVTTDSGMFLDLPGALVLALYTLIFGGPISGLACVLATPLARLLGRRLRRVRSRGVHLAAYAMFGALVGGFVIMLSVGLAGLSGDTNTNSLPYFLAMAMTLTAISAALGWLATAHQAFRKDVKRTAAAASASDDAAISV